MPIFITDFFLMMSSASESTVNSEASSPYESDGEVQCTFAKRYSSAGSEESMKDSLDFGDVVSQKEKTDVITAVTETEDETNSLNIYPRGVEENVDKEILSRIGSVATGKGNFVYVSSGLMNVIRIPDKISVPKCVLWDVCIVSQNKPMAILTFLKGNKKRNKVFEYNSRLARGINTQMRRETLDNFSLVHGVVDEDEWRSEDRFNTKMENLDATASTFALPYSLENSPSRCVTVIRGFLKMVYSFSDVADIYEKCFPERSIPNLVVTKAYLQALDVLQRHRHVVVTGGNGEGKTTVGRMLCHEYNKRGYKTFHFDNYKQADITLISEIKDPFLLVIDNMFEDYHVLKLQSSLTAFEQHVNSFDVILVFVCQLFNLKQAQRQFTTQLLDRDTTVDITAVNLNSPGSTKHERYHMMKLLDVNLSAVEMIKICNLSPYTMGFPKLITQYQIDRDPDPVSYFSNPHKYFTGLLRTLLKTCKEKMAALTLVLMNGGRVEEVKSGQSERLNAYLLMLQRKFHLRSDVNIAEELEYMTGTFLKNENGVFSFQNQVMYDACVYVLGDSHPDILWKHGNVAFVESIHGATKLSNGQIQISKSNLFLFLRDLADSLLKRQFRALAQNPLFGANNSVDILLGYLHQDLELIINSVDVRGRGNFLYWTCESGNDYMVDLLLQHSGRTSIYPALYCCVYSKQPHLFSYLWNKVKIHKSQCNINHQDENGKTLLLTSVEQEDEIMVGLLIQEGADPLIPDSFGNSSLHVACRKGIVNIVKVLLPSVGDNVNLTDGETRTPVMLAAVNGHWETFRCLANIKECDLIRVDNQGQTVLHLACISGSRNIVNYLLTGDKVDIHVKDTYGRTPLTFAASKGHGDVFQLLSEAGGLIHRDSDVELTLEDCNRPGFTGLVSRRTEQKDHRPHHMNDDVPYLIHKAARNGHKEHLEFLLSNYRAVVNMKSACGRTPLMEAALGGHKEVFDLLVKKGAILHLLDDNDNTILHMVCEGGNGELVNTILVQMPTLINTKNSFCKIPIMHAAEEGHHKAFQMLVNLSDLSAVDAFGNSLLHLACAGGSLPIVEDLLVTRDFDMEVPDRYGRTPVMIAAYHGYSKICHALNVKGCDLTKFDCMGSSILSLSVENGNVQSFADILECSKMSVNSQEHNGRTLAMAAAVNGKLDVLQFLIANGCDLTRTDDSHNNILHLACCAGEKEIVEIIIEKDIDINSRGQSGRTAFMMASERGYTEIADLLTNKSCNLHSRDDVGNNALHIACLGGHTHSVEYILSQEETDIDSRGQSGKTPATFAAEKGHKATFDLLVMKGCDLEIPDEKGNNLLHSACIGGNLGIVDYLLINSSFEVDSRGDLGRTPAMFAAFNGHLNLLIYLVKKQCDLSLLDDEDNTILHIACQGGFRQICHFLLYLGIFDTDGRGRYDRTPAMYAAYMNRVKVFELLVDANCDLAAKDENGDSVMHMACLGGSREIVQHLITNNFNVDQKGRYGRTPVMLAACKGHSELYWLLVDKNCDLTVKDSLSNNLLHMACRGGNVDIVEHALSLNRFDLDSKGQYGRTPVMIAAGRGHKDVVEMLLNRGCDLTHVDNEGNNILHVACLGGRSGIVKFLLSQKAVDKEQQNNFNFSPENLARFRGNMEISCLLQECSRAI